jgi:hypothetical protein
MGKRKTTSTNTLNQQKLTDFCGMFYAFDMLGGRWPIHLV